MSLCIRLGLSPSIICNNSHQSTFFTKLLALLGYMKAAHLHRSAVPIKIIEYIIGNKRHLPQA